MKYFALADCNNFYASCERAFDPSLSGKAVVVLSNNDGCIIARSAEAKALNIGMGRPYWEIAPILKKHGVKVFSSNYPLYGDMSERVMNILSQHSADMEVYSIDEAFLKLHPFDDSPQKLMEEQIRLRAEVLQSTGLPISIGIAPTKTLAKLANHIAKIKSKSGVYLLEAGAPILKKIAVGKVWGVAKGYQRKLSKIGVVSAADLATVNLQWMRKQFGVVGVRLVKELQGFPCYDLDPPITQRQNIMVSRSFRKDIYDKAELIESISTYATRLGEKLRHYDQAAGQLTVFLMANPFRNVRKDGRKYFARTMELPLATNHTSQLIVHATQMVERLYDKDTNYKKAGIIAGRLCPNDQIQGNLFVSSGNHDKLQSLMKAMDTVNKKMGKNTLHYASCGFQKKQTWSRKEQWSSPKFTTKWEDILCIKG